MGEVTAMTDACAAFGEAMAWVQANYPDFHFIVERDVVWTVQKRLTRIFHRKQLPLKVYNDFPIERGSQRSRSADLAVIGAEESSRGILNDIMPPVRLAEEFKFEPSGLRSDISVHKKPVTVWNGAGSIREDISRIDGYVQNRRAMAAMAVLIDEGGFWRQRLDGAGNSSRWDFWGDYGTRHLNVSVMTTTVICEDGAERIAEDESLQLLQQNV